MKEMTLLGKVDCLCIHHSATPAGNVEDFREEHKQRGFSDVGYHAVICNGKGGADGLVEPGRAEKYQGAGVYGANGGKLHVCLVGNFENTMPSVAQLRSLGNWLLNQMNRLDPAGHNIKISGHSEAAVKGHGTLCPGEWMRVRLPQIRTWVLARLAENTHADLPDWLGVTRGTPVAPANSRLVDDVDEGETPGLPTEVDEGVFAYKPAKVRVEVKGYVSEATKRTVKPQAVLVGGELWVRLRDLIDGLDWSEPEFVQEDGGGKIAVIATKRNVREARATLSGAPKEEGGAG